VALSKPVFDVRKIQPRQKWVSLFASDTSNVPAYFIFEKNQRDYIVFSIEDSLAVWRDSKPTEHRLRRETGIITHSLSKSVADIGAPADIAMELSSIYAWTIDFYRLQPNDQFEVLFEEELIDGNATGSCKILACSFTHNGRERKAYRYAFGESTNYFDPEGESLRKAFLKAPVKYSRISSRYTGKRFHPVLKTYKAHLGTDYAAPHGTPIMAVGDGTVIEASLDKGRGVITTVLIQSGTLHMGDPILAGSNYGKVKALMNERGQRVTKVGPAHPVQILGFNSAPQAGDRFVVPESDSVAKDIGNKRMQIMREQGMRTKKHITLDEIGRRLAIGNFKELNLVVKGDVDGSVEALSDSLMKLSTEQIQVNVIHKGVGQISESDVMLASASDAIIVGFQVRPLAYVRKLAEQEEIDIRTYSIIYDAINEIKSAMEGMLAPTFEEKVVCNVQIREVFKISKVGTIAGCMVMDGKINRNTKVRILREGIVIHTGELASLKRFKDDVKEVTKGYECGLNIANFNEIKEGDIIEGYERVEIKGKL
jgi:murein DD-endopeptidase MepM/ murein hydrolase activator NlpD